MTEIAINQFVKGLDKDTEHKLVSNEKAIEAINVELTGDGKFFSLKNIKGTRRLSKLLSTTNCDLSNPDNYNVLGAYEAKVLVKSGYHSGQTSDELNQCVVVFLAHKDLSNNIVSSIFVYDKVRGFTTSMYSSLNTSTIDLGFTLTSAMSAVVFAERGTDYIYFIDFVNPLRKLKLEIGGGESYPLPAWKIRDLTSQRYSSLDYLDYESVENGGNLKCGSYQFAYQLYNTENKKESAWSTLTNPIPIYPSEFNFLDDSEGSASLSPAGGLPYIQNGYYETSSYLKTKRRDFLDNIYGGLPGEDSTKRIKLSITATQFDTFSNNGKEYYKLYNSIRIAVIPHVSSSKSGPQDAFVAEPYTDVFTDFFSNGYCEIYYTGLESVETFNISKIVIEDAPIKTFKSLIIKDNILFGANVKYLDLSVGSDVKSNSAFFINKYLGRDSEIMKPATSLGVPTTLGRTREVSLDGKQGPSLQFLIGPKTIGGTAVSLGVTGIKDGYTGNDINERTLFMFPRKPPEQNYTFSSDKINETCNGSSPGAILGNDDYVDGYMRDEFDLFGGTQYIYAYKLGGNNIKPPSRTIVAIRKIKNLYIEGISGLGKLNKRLGFNQNNGEEQTRISQEPPVVVSLQGSFEMSGSGHELYYDTLANEINSLGLGVLAQRHNSGYNSWMSFKNPVATRSTDTKFDCDSFINAADHQPYFDGIIIGFASPLSNGGDYYSPNQPSDIIKTYKDEYWYANDNSSNFEVGGVYYGKVDNPRDNFGKNDFGYKNPLNCAKYKGHFRDEVYRYGITYQNEFGNWSPVKPFDFNSGGGNVLIQLKNKLGIFNLTNRLFSSTVVENTDSLRSDSIIYASEVGDIIVPPKCTLLRAAVSAQFVNQPIVITFDNGVREVKRDEVYNVIGSNEYIDGGTKYYYFLVDGILPTNSPTIVWAQPMYSYSENYTDIRFPSRDRFESGILTSFFSDAGEFPSGYGFTVGGKPQLSYYDYVTIYGSGYPVPGIEWKGVISNGSPFTYGMKDPFGINALGLQIRSIKNHPSWAKAFKIVRLERKKNIISQSLLSNMVIAMPYVDRFGNVDWSNGQGFSLDYGSALIKRYSFGAAFNIYRQKADPNGVYSSTGQPYYRIQEYDGNDGTAYTPLLFGYFPEYMYGFNNSFYYDSQFIPQNAKIDIVDVTGFLMDGAYFGRNSHRPIYYSESEFGTVFRSDFHQLYNNRGTSRKRSTFTNLDLYGLTPTGGGLALRDMKIIDSNRFYRFTTGWVLPNTFTKNTPFGKTINVGSYWGLSARNAGPSQTSANSQLCTEGYAMRVEYNVGDPTTRNSKFENTIPVAHSIFDFDPFNELKFIFPSSENNVFSSVSISNNGVNNEYNVLINRNTTTTEGYELPISDRGVVSNSFIGNLILGLSDDRYGDIETQYEWIDTGAMYVYRPGDISNNREINIDVWGGDCFITSHDVKLNQTTYTIDLEKEGPKTGGGTSDEIFRWTNVYRNSSEMGHYYVESEINTCLCGDKWNYPIGRKDSYDNISYKKDYSYHFGYSAKNDSKIWINNPIGFNNILSYPSRIVYSDNKVYQSEIEGFDRFGSSSFYDLDDTFRGITKLELLNNDNVFAIQEDAVAIIPINRNIIEQSDGTELIVNTSVLINQPRYITNKFGSNNIRAITSDGDTIFMVDTKRKKIFSISGENQIISDIGMSSYYNSLLELDVFNSEKAFSLGFDFIRKNLWVFNSKFNSYYYNNGTSLVNSVIQQQVYTFNKNLNSFESKIVSCSSSGEGAFSSNIDYVLSSGSNFCLIGSNNLGLYITNMYEGGYGKILGRDLENPEVYSDSVNSSVTIVCNPKPFETKVFDNIIVNSSDKLKSADFYTVKENTQTAIAQTNLNFNPRQSTYEAQILRDSSGGRARGTHLVGTFTIDNTLNKEVAITQILTKYRLSSRTIQ